MNKQIIIATLVGGVVSFLMGGIFYGWLLADFMSSNTIQYAGLMKPSPDMILLVLSNIFYCWLIAYIFDRWAKIHSFKAGAIAGTIVSLAVGLSIDTSFMAMMNLYKFPGMIADLGIYAITGAIVGGTIAFVLGKMKHSSVVAHA